MTAARNSSRFGRALTRYGLVITAAVLLNLACRGLGWDRQLLYATLGHLVRTLPPPAQDERRLVVVKLDTATLADARIPHWGPTTLSRRAQARVLRELVAGGARVVGYDIAFVGDSPDDGEARLSPDQELAQAMAAAPAVVLLMELSPRRPGGDLPAPIEPSPALLSVSTVRVASGLVRRFAATSEVMGVELAQLLPDGRSVDALAFACYKAFVRRDDLSADAEADETGVRGVRLARWPRPASGSETGEILPTISFREVWDGSWKAKDPELFRGKIALVGSFATGAQADRLKTPIGTLPGVMVHASVLQTLLDGARLRHYPLASDCLVIAAACMIVAAVYRMRPLAFGFLVGGAAAGLLVICAALFRAGIWVGPLQPLLGVAVFGAGGLLARAAAYRRALTYFAGSDAADLIAADGSLYRRTRVLTIFFSDVRGYTTLSEQLEPDALMDLLNAHFRWLDALVERNGGRVSAHIGDAMLAVFEGSRLRPNHAERALRTAVEACLTRAQRRGGADRLEFGIGIHTGEATSGTLGERKREYTVIGDAVNVAARLQQATRDVGVIVLASEAALEAAGPVSTADRFTRLDALQLKGKAEPVPVFTLDGDAGQLG